MNRRSRLAGSLLLAGLVVLVAVGLTAAPASAYRVSYAAPKLPAVTAGEQRVHLRYGPVTVEPGTNLILLNRTAVPKPTRDGYITRIFPNMTFPNGRVPRTDVLHLHHGVWINRNPQPGASSLFFASGEEKTIYTLPRGYGYPVRASDKWSLNYMVHNFTPNRYRVYFNYDVDFAPSTSAVGRRLKPAFPIWNDVEAGKTYPVFDVIRGSGRHGRFTYPDQAKNPYGAGPVRNLWRVPRDMTLLTTAGHLHPGGLWDDLEVVRPGATPNRRAGAIPGGVPHSVRVFRSYARYFDRAGPISWDFGMTATPRNWRVRVKKGDELRISATYDTRRGSWLESMGIMVAYASYYGRGVDPFKHAVPQDGRPTHGKLPENSNLGGAKAFGIRDPRLLPSARAPNDQVDIRGYTYAFGDLHSLGRQADPPAVKQGQSLTFVNLDTSATSVLSPLAVPHTVTGCRAPCNGSTGMAYPLANGSRFDSGQLALGPPGFTAVANRVTWKTPANLAPGTYTYFCRIHPFMRGSFRVLRR